jgi:hypothetical protein
VDAPEQLQGRKSFDIWHYYVECDQMRFELQEDFPTLKCVLGFRHLASFTREPHA